MELPCGFSIISPEVQNSTVIEQNQTLLPGIVERLRDTKRQLSCMIEIRRIWMFTQDFYLMTVRIKAPDHPAFALKTEKWGISNGWI